jgi:transposase
MYASGPNKVKQKMIRELTYLGMSVPEIASRVQVEAKSVEKWVEHFKKVAPDKIADPPAPPQPAGVVQAPPQQPKGPKPGPMPGLGQK